MATKHIGILGMQGAIAEHLNKLTQIPNVTASIVKTRKDLDEIDGLIIPGGESTAMGKLLNYFSLTEPLKNKIEEGLPVWGTCAGLILLAKKIENQNTTYLATMDITVRRNAYGSQLDSFSTDLIIPAVDDKPLPLVFIRAPYIVKADSNVTVLAKLDNHIIAAREQNILVSSFHPELTDDLSFHKYFVSMK